jgi:DNA-binding NarL/FixJ family response regulator
MIRVVLAEDHAVVRAGIEQLLQAQDDIDVVGLAVDGLEAIEIAVRLTPDVIVMDLSMPNLDGVAATRRILAELPEIKILILTSFSDRERIEDAIDAGAIGYVLKDTEPEDLVKAVRAAARGEAPLDPRAARVLLERRGIARSSLSLTQREEEVLILVADGLTNKLIARRLAISERTVKAHLTKIFQSLGVTDRTQAALLAKRMGVGDGVSD